MKADGQQFPSEYNKVVHFFSFQVDTTGGAALDLSGKPVLGPPSWPPEKRGSPGDLEALVQCSSLDDGELFCR